MELYIEWKKCKNKGETAKALLDVYENVLFFFRPHKLARTKHFEKYHVIIIHTFKIWYLPPLSFYLWAWHWVWVMCVCINTCFWQWVLYTFEPYQQHNKITNTQKISLQSCVLKITELFFILSLRWKKLNEWKGTNLFLPQIDHLKCWLTVNWK